MLRLDSRLRTPRLQTSRLLAHQLLAVADRDGEGDGGRAFAEARVEDADDATVVVEDGAAGVARPRRVDLQLVGVADDAHGLLLDAAVVVVLAAVDAPDVADRDGRVGDFYRGRVEGLQGVLRVDDAVDGLRDGGVAEDDRRVTGLYGVVVVVNLDRRHRAGAVNLDERHVVAWAD